MPLVFLFFGRLISFYDVKAALLCLISSGLSWTDCDPWLKLHSLERLRVPFLRIKIIVSCWWFKIECLRRKQAYILLIVGVPVSGPPTLLSKELPVLLSWFLPSKSLQRFGQNLKICKGEHGFRIEFGTWEFDQWEPIGFRFSRYAGKVSGFIWNLKQVLCFFLSMSSRDVPWY